MARSLWDPYDFCYYSTVLYSIVVQSRSIWFVTTISLFDSPSYTQDFFNEVLTKHKLKQLLLHSKSIKLKNYLSFNSRLSMHSGRLLEKCFSLK